MSSEESDPEDPMSLQKRTIPWRAEKISSFFYELDRIQEEKRTGQGKRQRKPRILVGESSSRPVPTVTDMARKYRSGPLKTSNSDT